MYCTSTASTATTSTKTVAFTTGPTKMSTASMVVPTEYNDQHSVHSNLIKAQF